MCVCGGVVEAGILIVFLRGAWSFFCALMPKTSVRLRVLFSRRPAEIPSAIAQDSKAKG